MNTKSLQETIRKPSPYLRRRIDMLDYEVEKNLYGQPFIGTNICMFFKSDVELFETVMENSIDAMYWNYFSHIDDNSGEWAHTYLDMVNYIRNKYQDKIMEYYDDNCGSGSIPLKESIRKVLREELNESTYFRRRFDMSSLDNKFFTNLNIVTDKYLKRHDGYCSFNVFRTTVISYLIDDYRDNLSDEDYDNFPYDEVYNFLFNIFYDKIKDRYVEVFGGDIDESENIRKVLKEETNYTRMLLRRLPTDILNNIDNLFNSSLNYISKMFIKTYKSDPRKLSEHEFTRMVIIDLMSLLNVRNHLPNDVEWYDDLLNSLSKHYKKRITSIYNVLKK